MVRERERQKERAEWVPGQRIPTVTEAPEFKDGDVFANNVRSHLTSTPRPVLINQVARKEPGRSHRIWRGL